MARRPADPTPVSPRRGQGMQLVYETLRSDILDLKLAPASPLDEVQLAAQFRLSRTPIREALVRLASEGLVLTLPNRSTIVAPISLATMPAYFEALTLMLRVTTRLAAINHQPEQIAMLRDRQEDYNRAVEREDGVAMIRTNRDFHVAIAEASGNPYFTQFFDRLMDEGRRMMRLYYQSFFDRLPFAFADVHRQMVDAIEARDAVRAEQLAGAHATQIITELQLLMHRGALDGMDLAEIRT